MIKVHDSCPPISLSFSPSSLLFLSLCSTFHSLADDRRTLSRPFPTARPEAFIDRPKVRPRHYVLSPARFTRDVTNLFSITLTVSFYAWSTVAAGSFATSGARSRRPTRNPTLPRNISSWPCDFPFISALSLPRRNGEMIEIRFADPLLPPSPVTRIL